VSLYGSLLSPEPLPTLNHHRFLSRFFSSTYKSLFPQLLSFLIYTKPQGYPPPIPTIHCPLPTVHSPSSIFIPIPFISLQIPLPATPFFSHLYKSPGGGVPLLFSFDVQHCPLPTIHFPFCDLRTLCPSCKTHLPSFQQNTNSFCKTPGVGRPMWDRHLPVPTKALTVVADDNLRGSAQYATIFEFRRFDVQTFRRFDVQTFRRSDDPQSTTGDVSRSRRRRCR
jgi:hypothetical protein